MKQMLIEVDQTDYEAIQAAIARRRTFRYSDGEVILPEGTANTTGGILAEICRGWVERLDAGAGKGAANGKVQ